MPHYYFDWVIDGEAITDAAGRELADLEDARKLAIDLVHRLARGRDKTQDMQCLSTVRDEGGAQVYHYAFGIRAPTPEQLQGLEERRERRAAARAARLARQSQ